MNRDKTNARRRWLRTNDPEYRKRDKEQQKTYNRSEKGKIAKSNRDRRYREKNKERLKEMRKRWDAKYNSSDKFKKFYESYYLNDDYRAKLRERYAERKDEPGFRDALNEANRRYHLTNKGKESSRRAWTLRDLRDRAAGLIDWKDVETLIAESKGKCHYCNCKLNGEYHIDHKIPVSKGGKSIIGNLVVSCPKCNRTKQVMTDIEFIAKLENERCGVLPQKRKKKS